MIYSGVDLIRKAESTRDRGEKLTGPKAVAAPSSPQSSNKDPDQQGALLRFARFVNKERRKKPVSKSNKHPYTAAFGRLRQIEDIGQMLNIYV
jgi:hypothetical protein